MGKKNIAKAEAAEVKVEAKVLIRNKKSEITVSQKVFYFVYFYLKNLN